jgi:LCP family protein required for cell wall assembly
VAEPPPDYTLYRSRPRGLRERLAGGEPPAREPKRTRQPRSKRSRRRTFGRIVKFALFGVVGWLGLSLVLFSISAQTRAGQGISSAAEAKLNGGGLPPLLATTILVLGTDRRPRGSKEPGAFSSGERTDTIMLLRVGGGASSKLSIPRDTVVPIPGHGIDKINSAYAYGGAALSIETIQSWTGVTIDHLIEIDLENFPKFIDSLGGITVTTPCVISDINGGTRNGGYSLRLRRGENNLDGGRRAMATRLHRQEVGQHRELLRAAHRQPPEPS